MTPKAFVATYRASAALCAAKTGVLPGVILAQWAHETGWGTSYLARRCKSLAGIRYYGHAGTTAYRGFACYASWSAFRTDYIRTMRLPYYRKVRAAQGVNPQIRALGLSPWSADHYGNPAGVNLLKRYRQLAPYL
jgi:flagellum-specific peptidoglycan hydrolase FlgJ